MIGIEILSALGDNYIYVAEYGPGLCFAVDPGAGEPVKAVVSQRNTQLTHILATHSHHDHTGGIAELQAQYCCTVVGPEEVDQATRFVQDGDVLKLEGATIRCMATPGHTAAGMSYYMEGKEPLSPVLFTGDTLFVCGCGRLFGGSGQTMFNSLRKLAALPGETRVYPGHDYTRENLQFALTLEPENAALKRKLEAVEERMQRGEPTVPSTLAEELKLNPFLKADTWETFAALRRKKDVF